MPVGKVEVSRGCGAKNTTNSCRSSTIASSPCCPRPTTCQLLLSDRVAMAGTVSIDRGRFRASTRVPVVLWRATYSGNSTRGRDCAHSPGGLSKSVSKHCDECLCVRRVEVLCQLIAQLTERRWVWVGGIGWVDWFR